MCDPTRSSQLSSLSPSTAHSAQSHAAMTENMSEKDFMASLIGDIEASFFNDAPSPATTPVKATPRKRARSLTKPPPNTVAGPSTPTRSAKRGKTEKADENVPLKIKEEAAGEDLDALLDGAEDWAWDDMLSPQKPKPSSPHKPLVAGPKLTPLPSVASLIQASPKKPVNTSWEPDPCTRCVIETVQEADGEMGRTQKV
jgi:hypothetical protein